MAVATAVLGCYLPSKSHYLLPSPPKIAAQTKPNAGPRPLAPPPIFVSTKPAHVNPHHLRELYAVCNHSCHRFPTVDTAGKVEPVDALKLRTAVTHSSIVVSVFTKPEFVTTQTSPEVTSAVGIGGNWIRKMTPISPENGQLIGFGRAVSDLGLTASIYDVMVHPVLQGRGIGRMIVRRIISYTVSQFKALKASQFVADCSVTETYMTFPHSATITKGKFLMLLLVLFVIVVLCRAEKNVKAVQRLFFRACGFGDDILGSTTMMYTRRR